MRRPFTTAEEIHDAVVKDDFLHYVILYNTETYDENEISYAGGCIGIAYRAGR
jgi:hypothetical protein